MMNYFVLWLPEFYVLVVLWIWIRETPEKVVDCRVCLVGMATLGYKLLQNALQDGPISNVSQYNRSASSVTSSKFCHSRIQATHRSSSSPEDDCQTSWQLFQLAQLCFVLAYLMPVGNGFDRSYALLMYSLLAVAHLLLISWIWICPDQELGCIVATSQFGWSILSVTIASVQIGVQWFLIRKFEISQNFRPLYENLFETIGLDRKNFTKLMAIGTVVDLNDGRAYAREGLTKCNDRLSLLLNGRLKVQSANQFLHFIKPFEFLDSPEWENGNGDNLTVSSQEPDSSSTNAATSERTQERTFKVTLIALEPSRYITWSRDRLETFLARHRQTDSVLKCLLGRDIANKLYSMNQTIVQETSSSSLDIRLPILIQSFTHSFGNLQCKAASSLLRIDSSTALNPQLLLRRSKLLSKRPAMLVDCRKASLQCDYPISMMVSGNDQNNNNNNNSSSSKNERYQLEGANQSTINHTSNNGLSIETMANSPL